MKYKYSGSCIFAIIAPFIMAYLPSTLMVSHEESKRDANLDNVEQECLPHPKLEKSISGDCQRPVLAITNSEYAYGLGKVAQKAESYMSKEHKESDWEICNISYHRLYMKSKNTKISEVKDKEYYWVWEVSFIRRKNIGKIVGGDRTVVMADTPNLDLIRIQRGK